MYTVGLDVDKFVFTQKILLYAGKSYISSPLIINMLGIIYLLYLTMAGVSAGNFSIKKIATAISINIMKFIQTKNIPKPFPFVGVTLHSGFPTGNPNSERFSSNTTEVKPSNENSSGLTKDTSSSTLGSKDSADLGITSLPPKGMELKLPFPKEGLVEPRNVVKSKVKFKIKSGDSAPNKSPAGINAPRQPELLDKYRLFTDPV
jgi:hypothetical protein